MAPTHVSLSPKISPSHAAASGRHHFRRDVGSHIAPRGFGEACLAGKKGEKFTLRPFAAPLRPECYFSAFLSTRAHG